MPAAPTRRDLVLRDLDASTARGDELDLVVIGGGINGAGVARDAARRGLRVLLVEQNDLAFGTSSRSSKLIHGGLRYLEQYHVHLVFESVSERSRLLRLAPHLVQPLGFLFPVYQGDKNPLWLVRTGMWVYDALSLFRSPEPHRTLDPAELARLVPELRTEGLAGAPLYFDAATDDARLTLETAIDAARSGALVATWTKVVGLAPSGSRIRRVQLEDALDGRRYEVATRAVVNATGPWSDALLGLAGSATRPLLRPTKGIHVVLDAARLPVPHAVVCRHPDDGRVLFVIPWGDRTYVGTTDTDEQVEPGQVRASHDDVRYLMRAIERYFPGREVREEHVLATWAGLRPLVSDGEGGSSESDVSREHKIFVGEGGMITVAGGKLTTYRKMAAEIVDVAVAELTAHGLLTRTLRKAETEEAPLPGAHGFDASEEGRARLAAEIAALGTLGRDVAAHLVATYGARAREVAARTAGDPAAGAPITAGRPDVLAQVDFAIDEELAATIADVLDRRTQISLRDGAHGLPGLDALADRMAARLGWSAARTEEEKARYRASVALQEAWRSEP